MYMKASPARDRIAAPEMYYGGGSVWVRSLAFLNAIDRGDARATDELLPLIYDELRLLAAKKLVHEPLGQTLQATALVHEAYLRLIGWKSACKRDPPW